MGIRKKNREILEGLGEANQQIKALKNQVDYVHRDLSNLIKTVAVQISYEDEFGDFELISMSYEDMKKGPYGIIVNNNQVEEFKEVVNHNHRGAVGTYTKIHRMIVTGSHLQGRSIFEIAPAFFSYLDYFLYVMQTLY